MKQIDYFPYFLSKAEVLLSRLSFRRKNEFHRKQQEAYPEK